MKVLVVYFSHNGQTGRMAKEIARRCGADLEVIREVRSDDSLWGRWRARWQTLARAEPLICQPQRNPGRYDLVIIGAPVWRLGIAPPVRSYIGQHRERFKQVAFFCAEGGDGSARDFAELGRLCGRSPVATFSVRRKGLPPVAHREGLTDFMNDLSPE